MRNRLALASLLLLVPACADRPDTDDAAAGDTAAMLAAVRARADGFVQAVLSHNVDSVLSYVTADIVLIEPGIDVKGQDAFRTLLADLWKVYRIRSFTLRPEAHTFAPDVVTEFGRYRETAADSTGTETVCDCVYSAIWRREGDGVWRQSRIHAGQPIKAP
jgi:ketosteroid isomerase-like protein